MSEIKIKCPTCGKVLRLAECPNINASLFTCPVCHDRHVVGNCQRYVQPPAFTTAEETRYGGMDHQCVGEETQVGSLQRIKVGTLVDQARTHVPAGSWPQHNRSSSTIVNRNSADCYSRPHHEPSPCCD